MAGVAEALMSPFQWGAKGKKKSRAEVEADREVAAALAARRGAPQNVGEGLNAIGEALRYNAINSRASEAEEAGRASAAELYAGLNDGYDQTELMGLVGNEWTDPAQQSVAQALLQQEMKKSDPEYQLDSEYKQAQIDALKAKPAQPLINAGEGNIYDPNTGEWISKTTEDGAAPAVSSKETFDREKDLYSQYAAADPVGTYELVKGGYERVRSSAELGAQNPNDSGAADISMIFAYMKMLDPTSVVREGEFATAENAGGIGDKVMNAYNRILSGGRLTPDLRNEFLASADALYTDVASNLAATNEQFTMRAQGAGVDPQRLIREPEKFEKLNLEQKAAVVSGQPIPVTSEEDYVNVPSGEEYVDPEGNVRIKK